MIWSLLFASYLLAKAPSVPAAQPLKAQDPTSSACDSSSAFSMSTATSSRRENLSTLAKVLFNTGAVVVSAIKPDSANALLLSEESNDLQYLEKKLLDKVNGRKPSSYKQTERDDMDSLIEEIISSAQGSTWERNLLPGKWRVAYIRPGINGGGLDRRIPFPELPFNESYQKFTLDSVTNIGELLGPAVRVEVGGSISEDDPDADSVPKRFRADIRRGDLCAGSFCVKLPIEGIGTFDGVYLGEGIRIGQNLNGSGALVVQVREL